ncbi:MAG: DoxX family protein [Longimicrobiales bacterium]
MDANFVPSYAPEAITLGIGLLVARLVLGLYMAAHGAQKLLGWFGGYGLAGTSGFFEQLGFRPGRAFAITAALAEMVSGVLLALGLLGPIGPALMISVLIVATVSVHWQNGVFVSSNGIEHTVVYAAAAFALALTGPGVLSLDVLLGLESLWTSGVVWSALALGIMGGLGNLAVRRPAPTQSAN